MRDSLFTVWLMAAALAVSGAWLVVSGVLPRTVRLDDALSILASEDEQTVGQRRPLLASGSSSRMESFGVWFYQHGHLPLTARTQQLLSLQGRTIGDYFWKKLMLSGTGLIVPWVMALILRSWIGGIGVLPVGLSLIALCVGWFWPDFMMRSGSRQIKADAQEAVSTYFDLGILERLANLSAAQSLEAASRLSANPVFVRIAQALDRARLEQRPPWNDLYRVSEELELPSIADMTDVMRLDEQGAALAEVLGARAKELRDEHVLAEHARENQTSERMTLWMSLPVVIFALTLLMPPLLRLVDAV